ncbi:hypothetical protein POSPLADRAFT_1039604 [Postia placenta MAD-698-R-SB12]|uniref:Uncharacterized protein n=1 Tax=Postia placenta MAD-698-R-SB12 TaxID=670580 RepID=A0A1X6N4U0_9APHY|nr:hypothetical protein POSPLADRAFT_1039604 [Postia placenta MAD-698-R-SB12]OSX63628.1 hypothetical protein POSPLADRAFT_1039604 [Postia placenta MAD-698-R-SB12]
MQSSHHAETCGFPRPCGGPMSLRDSARILVYTGAPFVDRPITDGVWNHSSLNCVRRGSTIERTPK